MKLGGSKPEAPAPTPDATPKDLPADLGGAPSTPAEEPKSDKPFNDEPFNAGVEADESSDPKKFIEQLTGKLGQSLRKYSEAQGQPDFKLEKFAINSLLSATHTSEMPPEDQDDIVKKVKEAGKGDEPTENPEDKGKDTGSNGSTDDGSGSEFAGIGGGDAQANSPQSSAQGMTEEKKDEDFLIKPKKLSIFAPEGSEEANYKNTIAEKLKETFNQKEKEMNEPMIEPQVQPVVKPAPDKVQPNIAPSRKNKPFLPMPTPGINPNPKAIKEVSTNNEIYHHTLASALEQAEKYAKSRGFETAEKYFPDITNGGVKYGQTIRTSNDDIISKLNKIA